MSVRDLRKSYEPGKEVLRGLTLEMETGSIYACLARNGVGKTTLVRTIMGMYQKEAGEVAVFGRAPESIPFLVETLHGSGLIRPPSSSISSTSSPQS